MYEYDDPDEEVEIPGLGFVIGVLVVLGITVLGACL